MRKIKGGIFSFIFLILLYLASTVPARAAGATLFFSPNSGSFIVGNSFTVNLMVSSGDSVGVNAAEGTILLDQAALKAETVAKTGSIFSLWTQEPTLSNKSGQVSFGGGSPSPYRGSAGKILSVTFSGLKTGETKVTITNGLALAADGKGTNILDGTGSGTFTIGEALPAEEKKPAETKKEPETAKGYLPPAPEVSSPTHPNEDEWYANNDPEFAWKLLTDIFGISYSITPEEKTDPGSESDGIVESNKFEDVGDGSWYFNVKFKNKVGWGPAAYKKFQVDVTPPTAFDLIVDNENDPTNPTPLLKFKSEDKTSGISKYVIQADEAKKEVSPNEVLDGKYRLDLLMPGEHTAQVVAVDLAGNAASSTKKFIVEALKLPVITDLPTDITTKDSLIIRGTSFYPQVTIQISIAREGEDPMVFETKTDDQGNWSYFHKGQLEKGIYEVWAKLIDRRGAQSYDTSKNVLRVSSPSFLQTYGWLTIIILLILVIIEEAIIIYMRHKFMEERRRIMRETQEAKETVVKVFNALKEELDEQMEFADKKKGLSESERRVKIRMQEALDIAQEFIDKEIEDAEKEIKIKKSKI